MACTEGAAVLFGITVSEIHERAVHVRRLLPSIWDAEAGRILDGTQTAEAPGNANTELHLASFKLAGEGYSATVVEITEAHRHRVVPELSRGSDVPTGAEVVPTISIPLPPRPALPAAAATAAAAPAALAAIAGIEPTRERAVTVSRASLRPEVPDESVNARSQSQRWTRNARSDPSQGDGAGVLDDWARDSASEGRSRSGSGSQAQTGIEGEAVSGVVPAGSADNSGGRGGHDRSRISGPPSVAQASAGEPRADVDSTSAGASPHADSPVGLHTDTAAGWVAARADDAGHGAVDERMTAGRLRMDGTVEDGFRRSSAEPGRATRAVSATFSSDDEEARHVLLRRAEDSGATDEDERSHQGSKHASSHGSSSHASSMGVRTMHNAIKVRTRALGAVAPRVDAALRSLTST